MAKKILSEKDHKYYCTWEDRLKRMLDIIGRPGECKGCGKKLFFVGTKRDALLPYTAEGLPHFADCPKANEFRKKKK